MKKLLPIILFIVGSGAGVAAGIFLKPEVPEISVDETPEADMAKEEKAEEKSDKTSKDSAKESLISEFEYIKLKNQFVVPIVKEERIASMVVTSLSLEVVQGYGETIMDVEPKLRSEFLRVMFDHANIGGFDGMFTELSSLDDLQTALREVAQKILGADIISDVLIFEIARQDY